MSSVQLLFAQAVLFIVDAADFDGTNDHLSGSALTAIADSKSGIFSCWVKKDAVTDCRLLDIRQGGVERVKVDIASSAGSFQFTILGSDSAGSTNLTISTSNTYTSGVWYHVLASWDLAAGATHLYVNGTSDNVTPFTVNSNIDYTGDANAVGATITPALRLDGGLAEVYFAPGQFLDFSNSSNRGFFRSSNSKPVSLGTTGEIPTGVVPKIYLHLSDAEAPANFATNRSGNGNFTITGTLTTYATSPSD